MSIGIIGDDVCLVKVVCDFGVKLLELNYLVLVLVCGYNGVMNMYVVECICYEIIIG